jgi:hypothetical protein
MKKDVASRINKLAERLPVIFKVEHITILMEGWELNLSGYGEYKKYDKDKVYEVPFIQYRAVMHEQQLKDAFKRGGMSEVSKYVDGVLANYEKGEDFKIAA